MPLPKPLTDQQAKNSLAHRLTRVGDKARQIATKLGVRPYRVFLVWDKYTGVERGEGKEKVLVRREILPTPLIENLDSVNRNPYAHGITPEGVIRVTEISAREWTEDQLTGRSVDGARIEDPYGFFYEIYMDGRFEKPQHRQKYRLSSQPMLVADNVMWRISLERISEDATREGVSQLGPDHDD